MFHHSNMSCGAIDSREIQLASGHCSGNFSVKFFEILYIQFLVKWNFRGSCWFNYTIITHRLP